MTGKGNVTASLVVTGDEMNLHTPQSYEAEAELRLLPAIEQHIITAQESKPIITITQDSLVAAFLMTRYQFALSRGQFNSICMSAERDGQSIFSVNRLRTIEQVLKKQGKNPDWLNGRGLVSLLLPETLNYQKKNNAHPDEPTVKIVQGVFLEGALDKNVLGAAHGSLIQILNKEYGAKITAAFIDNMQFVGNNWLLIHGFSIGLEDCMITSQQSVMAIRDTLTQCYTKAEGIEESTQNPGIREVRVTAALSQAKDIGMRIAKDAMRPDNNFLVTVTAGAKGDYFNIAQLTGLLGQQNLEGKRVTPALNHGQRTLPHYPFGQIDKEREYESRGFIRNSFIHGLTPEEFFFHAMSGREGVIDTAMGTSKSGYIQRKIVKVCEDIQIQYDGTVRDASGKIYQFVYGENNYDATKTIRLDNEPAVCDVGRLVDKLNLACQLGTLDREEEFNPSGFVNPPRVSITRQTDDSEEQRIWIDRIKQIDPECKLNDQTSIKELKQYWRQLREEDKNYDEAQEEDKDENDDDEEDKDEDSEEDPLDFEEEDEDKEKDEEEDKTYDDDDEPDDEDEPDDDEPEEEGLPEEY